MDRSEGDLRHEIVTKIDEHLLQIYLPKDVASSAVPTYDERSQKSGRVYIYFATPEEERVGSVEVDGYVLPNPIQAKFNKKQGRYTFNLLKASKAESSEEDRDSSAQQDVDREEHYSDAASSGSAEDPQPHHSADQPSLDILYQQASTAAEANGTAHCAEQDPQDDDILDAEEQEDSEEQEPEPQRQQELSKPQPPPPPPQQQPSKAAAAASEPSVNGLDDGSADEEDEEDADGAAADEDGQAKKPKKRRGQKKKKKKKSKGGSATAEEAVQDSSSAAAASNSNDAAAADQSSKEDEDTDVFFDAPESMSDNDEAASQTSSVTSSSVQAGASGKETPAPAAAAAAGASKPAQIDAAAGPRVPDSFTSENYLEFFSEEPCAGTSWLPTQTEEPQQPANLLQGPAVAACLDRHEYKGEDKGLKVVGASWTPAGSSVSTPFSAFGVFDGHGGKSAATFASKELLPTVARLLDRCMTAGPPAATPSRQHSSLLSPKASAGGAGLDAADADDGDSWGVGVSEEDRAVWAAQEAMAERLPMSMFAGFLEADKTCRARFPKSGTTATLAIVVGWEVIVANVGDSAAYLDTGKQVICLTGNHRVDDNPAERERVIAEGGEISKSQDPDTKEFIGPNRVWPGGLNMSRTIGDPQAPQVIAVPEVRHVTLPTTGGRIIIASDGVWDHMQPKSMIHQVRNDNTEAAAKKISAAAIKKKGLRDDISVLVIDLVPQAGDVRPPALLPGPTREAAESCQVLRPLLEASLADGSSSGDTPRGNARAARSNSGQLPAPATGSSSDRHWREAAAARHGAALKLLRSQARALAEAQAAEEARAAERAAAIAAAAAQEAESETYRQLKSLKLDRAQLAQLTQRQQEEAAAAAAAVEAAADTDGWTTVKGSSSKPAAEDDTYVTIEQKMRVVAHQYEEPPAQPAAGAADASAAATAAVGAMRGRGKGRGRPQGRRQQHDQGYQEQQPPPPPHPRDAAEQPQQTADGSDQHHPEGHLGGRGGRFGGRGGRYGGRGGRFGREHRPRGSDEGGHYAPTANGPSHAEHDSFHNNAAAEEHHAGGRYHPHQQQYRQPHQQHQQPEHQPLADGEQQQQQERPSRGRGRGGHGGRGGRGRGRFGQYDGYNEQQQLQQSDAYGDSFGGDSFGQSFSRAPARQGGYHDQQHVQQPHQQAEGVEVGEGHPHQHGRGRGSRRGRGGRGERREARDGQSDAAAAAASAGDSAPAAPAAVAGEGAADGAEAGAGVARRARRPKGRGRGAGGEQGGGSPRVSAGEAAGSAAFRSDRPPSNLQHESTPAGGVAAGTAEGAVGPEGAGRGGGSRRGSRRGGRGGQGPSEAAYSADGGQQQPEQPMHREFEGGRGSRGGGRGGRRGGRSGGGRGFGQSAPPAGTEVTAQ